ncbi:spore germination protein, GerA family [[Clostridium] cellulosi]|uniref:Spore germination protein, GerA family n=1 Tax=[Clostridium] cellulosi TaxID=29343 RepID=A0A078KIE0_9FIRM|nr:spore germination protein, GerA family [[Clostridium] cellulosi]
MSNTDNVLKTSLDENINLFNSIFKDDETLIIRYVENRRNPKIRMCFLYIDGMVDNKIINQDMIKPVEEYAYDFMPNGILDKTAKSVVTSGSVNRTNNMEEILESLLYGSTILIADGENEALILETKGWKTRSIVEPKSEKVLRGPREGFVESIMMNISMVRRRIKTPDLKFNFLTLGTRTKTKVCICYLESLVNKNVLDELNRRLNSFEIDGVLDANYISEMISDAPYSPVKTIGSTEKPDVVAAKLLEGRIAMFVDGTPMVLTCPCLFIENFQSDEDYYINYYFSSIGRFIRISAFFISIMTPAIYVAVTTFHQEFLPTKLLLSISAARQGVPFPTVFETLLLLVVFEILREAGARMPQSIGQTLSIVGVLVLGQAAVEAKIVSAPIIIVVAITGLTGIMVPRIKGLDIIVRFGLLVVVSIAGLYGFLFAMLGLLIHLYNLNSFGVPILDGMRLGPQNNKDTFMRAPWWHMKNRPQGLTSNIKRESVGKIK